jgi:hypothetical protein
MIDNPDSMVAGNQVRTDPAEIIRTRGQGGCVRTAD